MASFKDVLENIFKRKNGGNEYHPYGRVFIVSAYAGVTDMLLENKKTKKPGVFKHFVRRTGFEKSLKKVLQHLKNENLKLSKIGLERQEANEFIENYFESLMQLLHDLDSIMSSGYMLRENILHVTREILASVGEVHSAYNTAMILRQHGIKAVFVDLSGLHDPSELSINDRIKKGLQNINFASELPILSGYVKGLEGIMREFDRGYSDVTFGKTAFILHPKEAILHKEFHLSSADPGIVGEEQAMPVGRTNYDVADQLADVGMEAIHPKVSKMLEKKKIPLRIKNTFEPEHTGTFINNDYRGERHRIEIITGTKDVIILEVHDPSMVGVVGFDRDLSHLIAEQKVSYLLKTTNANTISQLLWEKDCSSKLYAKLKKKYYLVTKKQVAVICVIGTNIAFPGVMAQATLALSEKKISILVVSQSARQVNMQFVIERKHYELAVRTLHESFMSNLNNAKKPCPVKF